MTRARLASRLVGLLLYLVYREWLCGQPSAVHPTEAFVTLVKVIGGADLYGVDA